MQLSEVKRVIASIAPTHHLQRISGGSETDVYQTDEGRYVLKVKRLAAATLESACVEIEGMQSTATDFAASLGSSHSIRTDFVLGSVLGDDHAGHYYAIAIQPYLHTAIPLSTVDYQSLTPEQRSKIEWQLLFLLRQSLQCHDKTGLLLRRVADP